MYHAFVRRSAANGVVCVAFAVSTKVGALIAHADEEQAKQIFKAMSDYMTAQQNISFDFDTSFEVVSTEGQKIAFASSGSVTMKRPDKIRATRSGGFADVELVF